MTKLARCSVCSRVMRVKNACPRCQWPMHRGCMAAHAFRCRGADGNLDELLDRVRDQPSQEALDLSTDASMLPGKPVIETRTSEDGLRKAARTVADQLYQSAIGGPCYHGELHTCFARQGRRPLALYKPDEMCERCQATWHALMTAALVDSLTIGTELCMSKADRPSKRESK